MIDHTKQVVFSGRVVSFGNTQARVPAGQPGGGQWVKETSVDEHAKNLRTIRDSVINPEITYEDIDSVVNGLRNHMSAKNVKELAPKIGITVRLKNKEHGVHLIEQQLKGSKGIYARSMMWRPEPITDKMIRESVESTTPERRKLIEPVKALVAKYKE